MMALAVFLYVYLNFVINLYLPRHVRNADINSWAKTITDHLLLIKIDMHHLFSMYTI